MKIQIRTRQDGGYLPFADTLPTVRVEVEQRMQAEHLKLEQCHHKLLQEHMNCGVIITKLEAQVAEYLAFMERFRTALQQEEHGSQQ